MKIAIFGCPGSGKSTFATKISKKLSIPVYHLDKYFFKHDWQEVGLENFVKRQKEILALDRWIVEGCSMRSLELRFQAADLLICLDITRRVCLWRVVKRWWAGRTTDCKPENCPEKLRLRFLKYVWNYRKRYRPDSSYIQNLAQKYPNKKLLVFTSNKLAEQWLEDVTI
ncbi:MAG: AAA family ATPase [Epsilonproteobacteria bacterium]|nr:AAA family ATPase [Campylobacterota bacterium]